MAVNPGDTIHYLATVSNTGDTDATGVNFTLDLDDNAPLVAGTLKIGPHARRDSYNAVGNTTLTVNAASGLRANDIDIDGLTAQSALVVTAGTFATSQGGSITIAADGSFTYTPQTGDRIASDTFTYSISDGDSLVGTGTVTLNLNNTIVWYVDSTAGTTGDGSFANPFDSLTDLSGPGRPDLPGEIIHVRERAGDYTGGITLLANQQLLGSSVALTVNTINIFTAGSQTTLSGAGITLASGNTVKSFDISGTSGAGISGSGIASGTFDLINITTPGTSGISLTNATGMITFGTATTDVNVTGGAGGAAFSVSGGTATITYNGDITQASNNALVSIRGGHGTGTITFQNGTLSATNGTGLQFDNADGTYNFNSTTTLNGGDAGIDIINGSSGNFTFTNAPITNPSGAAFLVNGGNGTISHTGTISKTSAGRLIDIQGRTGGSVTFAGNLSSTSSSSGILAQNNTGGTISFDGGTKTLNTGTNNAVTLSSNTGATINFTGGGLDIDMTTGTGFSATGGGTISVTGASNSSNSSSGASALVVQNTTIGSNGLTFASLSSNGGSAPGIFLDTTGSSGGLTVTGDGVNTTRGGNSSGGTIGNKDDLDATPDSMGNDGLGTIGTAIYLNNTRNGVLRRMTINGTNQNFAIYATDVTNFTMEYSTVGGANGDAFTTAPFREGSVIVNNLFGNTNSVFESIISGGFEDNFRIENTSATPLIFNLTNSTIQNNNTTSGNIGFRFASITPGTNMTATISGNLFQGNRSESINTDASNGTVNVTITNNTIIAGTGGNNRGNLGINVSSPNAGTMTFSVTGNKVGTPDGTTNASLLNTGINLFAGGTTTTLVGSIKNNDVINGGTGLSGHGIQVFQQDSATIRANIDGNRVSNVGLDNGITVTANGSGIGPSTGRVEVGITNNDSSILSTAINAIRVRARRDTVLIAEIAGNTATTNGGGFAINASQANTAQFQLEDDADGAAPELALGSITAAAVQTYLAA